MKSGKKKIPDEVGWLRFQFDIQWKPKRKCEEYELIQGSHIFWCLCLFMVFFQTRRAGEECAEQGYLAVLGQYCHHAEIISSSPSHEQFLLARPSSGGKSGQWKAKRNLNPRLAPLPFSLRLGRSSAESGRLGRSSAESGPWLSI